MFPVQAVIQYRGKKGGAMEIEQIGGKKNSGQKMKILFSLFIIIHIIFAVYLGMQKINYHYDERLTFGLANNTMSGVKIENGKVYHGFSLYNDYLSVRSTERFDYKGVWKNQAKDVHPPFYYVIIHTICSFFPEQYSKWFGIVPNIIFMILVDLLLYQLANFILKDKGLALITAAAAGTTILAMNMVIFIRMYAMMTVFVVGISLVFIVYFDREKDWKFYTGCYMFTVGGTMTQYYFLIYLFFLCLFFGIRLLVQKKWRETAGFVTVFFAAGGSCFLIFPAMLKQIFGGSKRGRQALEAIQTFTSYDEYLKEYYKILNRDVFGGIFLGVMAAAVLLIVFVVYKRGWKRCFQELNTAAVMLLFAGILYIIVIAKIAPYRTLRYIMPFGWIFILFSIWLYQGAVTVLKINSKVLVNGIALILFLCMGVNSLRLSDWQYRYTYQSMQPIFDIVQEYKDCSAVCVYKKPQRTACNAEELRWFKDYVFAKPKDLEKILEEREIKQMVLYIINRSETDLIMNTALQGKESEHAKFLFNSGYANVYYIE